MGVQWAVLTIYARTLSVGPDRQTLLKATRAGAPSKMGQVLAMEVLEHSGLTSGGKFTATSEAAALAFLALKRIHLTGKTMEGAKP